MRTGGRSCNCKRNCKTRGCAYSTPGTNLDTQALDETKNNYLMCIAYIADRYGVSVADVTTGDYFVTEIENSSKLFDEIYKFMPSELICNEAFYMSGMDIDDLKDRLGITVYAQDAWYFDDVICEKTLKEHFHCRDTGRTWNRRL